MNRLRIKSIESVGAVDAGDDPEALMVFWKRAHSKTTPLGGGKQRKGTDMAEFSLADLELPDDQAEALDTYIAEKINDAVSKALAEEPDVEDDDVLKGLSDEQAERVAELQKKADETAEQLAAEIRKRETAEWVRKADEFADLIGPSEETGPVLRDLAAAAPEATETLLGWLGHIRDKADLAELFKVSGRNEPGDVESRKDSFVKEYLAKHEGATVIEARKAFWDANPDAVEASREGIK